MTQNNPQIRDVAAKIIAFEALRSTSPATDLPPTFHLTDTLRPHLTTLMGHGGFRALLSRALTLARPDVSWLIAIHVEKDGRLSGLEEARAQLDPAEFLEGRVAILSRLLGLLVTFIGPSLTARLVGEIWPHISHNNLDFGQEVDNENA